MNPKVSVIIPCYNEPKDIFCRSLNSVIKQTLKDIEIILILDNPENQELRNIIEWYKSEHENILFLDPGKNLWRWWARNLAISHASGKYIAIHDADDIDFPTRLEDQYIYMEENPHIWVMFSNTEDINNQGEIVNFTRRKRDKDNGKKPKSLFNINKNHQTMFSKTELSKEFKYKDMDVCEDLELWMNLFRNNIQIWYLDKLHTQYLNPMHSQHSDYVKKIRAWKKWGIKVMLSHFSWYYKDIYFYREILINISEYLILMLWRKIYEWYRDKGLKLIMWIESIWSKKNKKEA